MRGYDVFRATLDRIGDAFDGDRRLRYAIGSDMAKTLRLLTRDRKDDQRDYTGMAWFEATPDEFEHTAQHYEKNVSAHPDEELTAQAPWKGGILRVFQRNAYLVSPKGHHILVVMICEDTSYDTRAGKNMPSFRIYLTDTAGEIVPRDYSRVSKNSTNAKTHAAAYTSLRRMVEGHFNLTLENVS